MISVESESDVREVNTDNEMIDAQIISESVNSSPLPKDGKFKVLLFRDNQFL